MLSQNQIYVSLFFQSVFLRHHPTETELSVQLGIKGGFHSVLQNIQQRLSQGFNQAEFVHKGIDLIQCFEVSSWDEGQAGSVKDSHTTSPTFLEKLVDLLTFFPVPSLSTANNFGAAFMEASWEPVSNYVDFCDVP